MIQDLGIKTSNGSKTTSVISSIRSGNDPKSRFIKTLSQLDKLRGHNFITKEILDRAEKIGKQENNSNPEILVKYFSPSMTFYIIEIDIDNPDQAFGYVSDETYGEGELGNISLNELSLAKNKVGMPVERDMYFGIKTLNEVKGISDDQLGEDDGLDDKLGIDNEIKEFSDDLMNSLEDEINGKPQYESHCMFTYSDDVNEFEVIGKFSNGLPNWDKIILSHKSLSTEEKQLKDEELLSLIISRLNSTLEATV